MIEEGIREGLEILHNKLKEELGLNVVITWADAPRDRVGPDGRPVICPGRFYNDNAIAGHTCFKTQEEIRTDDGSNVHGESTMGFAQAQCTAMNGYWKPYRCRGVDSIVVSPEVQAVPTIVDFFVQAWSPVCCTDEDTAGMDLAANDADDSATFHFNTQNIFSNQNIFGDAPEGTKIFTG